MLFKQLVGTRALSVGGSTAPGRTLRVYAFCSRNITGGVVLVALNLNASPASFTLDTIAAAPRVEYQLTAPSGNMSSQIVLLNGVELVASAEGQLPSLAGHVVEQDVPIELGPTSYGLFVLPAANAPACM